MGPKKEALGMASPPPVPTTRVPGALDSGSAPGGLPRLEVSPSFVTKGLRASEPLSVSSSKPLQRYSRKFRGSRFLKMDNRLIAEAISSFSASLVFSSVVTSLVDQS
jgi:hypothetical protein